jgi:regulator of protease activity HflC (stomatin/prohibitin superfamily)
MVTTGILYCPVSLQGKFRQSHTRVFGRGIILITTEGSTNIPIETPASLRATFNVIAAIIFLGSILTGLSLTFLTHNPLFMIVAIILGTYFSQSPKVVQQWEKAVVLRLGSYIGLRGPGLFWIIPGFDSISTIIDERVITTAFTAEQTLTADTVPVNVDAVLFWKVIDPEKAALAVQDYKQAISWGAQTTLRDIIGRTSLANLLKGREMIEQELQKTIGERVNSWGLVVHSVEMRDVVIPDALQDAMSREAQAEVEIAKLFRLASVEYENNPTAIHLRAMNMLYEGLKEKGAMMIVPSTAVESMGLGGMLGTAAMRQQQLTHDKVI